VDATVWDETLAQLTTLFTYGQAAVGWFLHKNQPGQLVCLTGRRPSSGEALGESHQALAAGGITALVRSMALELQHTGIRINGVELGVTAPNPSQPGATPSRAYRRDNVAALVEFFTSAAAQNLTGQIVGIDGQHLWLRRNQETAGLVQRDGPWTAEAVATSWARLTR
jgi:3-oxoacyl-[acyl-carrier protein] reductase